MLLELSTYRLELKHTWTIARGSADFKEYNFVELRSEGIVGRGEAAHNIRYGESLESIREFLLEARSLFDSANPYEFYELNKRILALTAGQNAAKASLDMALLDWVTQRLQIPLYALWGLNPAHTPKTSYSIGIDSPQAVYEKAREAEAYPILKIKLGSEQDEEIMRAVREATDRPVRIDANEGWQDRQLALEKMQWLAGLNVEFVEQPIPAGRLAEVAWLRDRSPLPLVADEDVKTVNDIPALARAYHGINIKIMKSGGLQEALRMIHVARALGLKIMLGCMIESSLGITAAAHLSPLVDWADLDGNLLIKNDPYRGVKVVGGRLLLPHAPGLGVERIQSAKIG